MNRIRKQTKTGVHWNRGLIAGLAIIVAILALAVAGCATSPASLASPTSPPAPASPTKAAAQPTTAPASLANSDLIVESDWLAQRLADSSIRIIDARAANDYKAGHIKGAVSIPVGDTFLPTGPGGMAGSPEQIASLFGGKGISNDNRVIVYDAGNETSASRIFWTLELYGHKKVSVLNGGFKKWQKENKEIATADPTFAAVILTVKAEPARNVTLAEMKAAVGKPGIAIVDARSPEEYRGEDVRTKRGGHIQGAVNIDWRTLFTADATFKSVAELTKMYQDQGVTKDKEVYAHCQTGQRSAVTYLTLRLLGYEKVRNYDGSWQEWGNETDTPIVK